MYHSKIINNEYRRFCINDHLYRVLGLNPNLIWLHEVICKYILQGEEGYVTDEDLSNYFKGRQTVPNICRSIKKLSDAGVYTLSKRPNTKSTNSYSNRFVACTICGNENLINKI